MMMIASLLDEVMDQPNLEFLTSARLFQVAEAHECDGCGETLPDVDLFAENRETGEQIWLCLTCGD